MSVEDISDFLQNDFYPIYDDDTQFCGNARDGRIIIWYIEQLDNNIRVTIEVSGIVDNNGSLIVSTFEEFINFYNYQIQLYGIMENVYNIDEGYHMEHFDDFDEAIELDEAMENLDLNSRDYGLLRFSAG